jgi:hypothetical protein
VLADNFPGIGGGYDDGYMGMRGATGVGTSTGSSAAVDMFSNPYWILNAIGGNAILVSYGG